MSTEQDNRKLEHGDGVGEEKGEAADEWEKWNPDEDLYPTMVAAEPETEQGGGSSDRGARWRRAHGGINYVVMLWRKGREHGVECHEAKPMMG